MTMLPTRSSSSSALADLHQFINNRILREQGEPQKQKNDDQSSPPSPIQPLSSTTGTTTTGTTTTGTTTTGTTTTTTTAATPQTLPPNPTKLPVVVGGSFASHLEPPRILFQSNHLLAVYKPPGWHSVPNQTNNQNNHNNTNNNDHSQCLLSYCRHHQWGGGSDQTFLLPLHRLDQPCSGVLLLGKTRKAAQRIQSTWSDIAKVYHCVVPKSCVPSLLHASSSSSSTKTTTTTVTTTHPNNKGKKHRKNTKKIHSPNNMDGDLQPQTFQLSGWLLPKVSADQTTVRILPTIPPSYDNNDDDDDNNNNNNNNNNRTTHKKDGPFSYCHLEWSIVGEPSSSSSSSPFVLLQITTNQGRRHMIRALLGQVGSCPIAGDLRYATKQQQQQQQQLQQQPLPNQSVALHATQITLPPQLRLGGGGRGSVVQPQSQPPTVVEDDASHDHHQQKHHDHPSTTSIPLAGRSIYAPLPFEWQDYFGIQLEE